MRGEEGVARRRLSQPSAAAAARSPTAEGDGRRGRRASPAGRLAAWRGGGGEEREEGGGGEEDKDEEKEIEKDKRWERDFFALSCSFLSLPRTLRSPPSHVFLIFSVGC